MNEGDTVRYINKFLVNKSDIRNNLGFEISKDVGFDFLVRICAYLVTPRQYLLICATLFVVPLIFAYKNLFNNKMLLPLYLFICFFFFWNLGSNIIRQGFAVSFFMLAISITNKKWLKYICFAISIFMHLSIVLSILFYIVAKYFKNDTIICIIWIVCVGIAYIGINIFPDFSTFLESYVSDQRLGRYANMRSTYHTGFRFYFILFSFVFIVWGYFF
jgi:hypothetical protein